MSIVLVNWMAAGKAKLALVRSRFGLLLLLLFGGDGVLGATIERMDYQLVDGVDKSGVWISGKIWTNKLSLPGDRIVRAAIDVNKEIVDLEKTGDLKQEYVTTNFSSINLNTTPALLPVDAREVDYNTIWLWGDNVLLDANYKLPEKFIPWRSDYLCETSSSCKLLTTPKDQMFELSYYLFKLNNSSANPVKSSFKNEGRGFETYIVNWRKPLSVPEYEAVSKTDQDASLIWKVRLKSVNERISLDKENKWSGGKNEISNLLQDLLNVYQQQAESLNKEPYDDLFEQKGVAFFERKYDQLLGRQTSKRLVYKEQVLEMMDQWESLNVIGYLDLEDRGFVFVQPKAKRVEDIMQPSSDKAPVSIFEYTRIKDKLSLVFGVKTDWTGALMANDFLLEAVRVGSKLR